MATLEVSQRFHHPGGDLGQNNIPAVGAHGHYEFVVSLIVRAVNLPTRIKIEANMSIRV